MKFQSVTLALLCSGMGLFFTSCEKNDATLQPKDGLTAVASSNATDASSIKVKSGLLKGVTLGCSFEAYTQAVLTGTSNNAVLPSACSPTALDAAVDSYVKPFGPLEFEWYGTLAALNQYYSYVDTSTPYFGVNGELTQVATKYKRDLESFWNMPNEVDLHGQHNVNLLNRDAIASAYIELVGAPKAIAYANADYLIANVVKPSTVFQTTPLLSFDGFATTGGSTYTGKVVGNLIVIGDGILKAMTDTGVEPKVAFGGILAHEWGHQVQFNNYTAWYGDAQDSPEQTRKTELEADVFASYYLTHKRGATYNWKSAAEFFELFFNIGDCSFTSAGHHGTPNQRLAASRLGWIIAQETMPMGHILTAQEVHSLFIASLQSIIDNKIDSSAALASLKTPQLKAIYGKVKQREQELKGIANGTLSPGAVKNL